MKAVQNELFDSSVDDENEKDADQRESWLCCWDWEGPKLFGVVSFDGCFATDTTGRVAYVMMCPAMVLSIEGDFYLVQLLGELAASDANADLTEEECENRRFNLRASEIWPYIHGDLIENIEDLPRIEKK